MKYIFWDFNGTVLDDVDLCLDILNEMLLEEGRKTIDKEKYLNVFTFPIKAYYSQVFDLNISDFNTLAHRFIKRYQPRSLSCNLHEHVIDTVLYFKKLGYFNILLSASEESNLLEQLNHYHIHHLFDHVLGTKNIYAKTKLDVAKAFIKDIDINKEKSYMIGDTLHDAEVATDLGIHMILYTGGHQHRKRFKTFQTIDSFKELKHIIKP